MRHYDLPPLQREASAPIALTAAILLALTIIAAAALLSGV